MSARIYARQARLAEVGVEGQARIERIRARVEGGGLAGELAAAYLARAGAVVVEGEAEVPTEVVRVGALGGGLGLSGGPAAVAEGALAAIVALRAALGLGHLDDRLETTETDAARHV